MAKLVPQRWRHYPAYLTPVAVHERRISWYQLSFAMISTRLMTAMTDPGSAEEQFASCRGDAITLYQTAERVIAECDSGWHQAVSPGFARFLARTVAPGAVLLAAQAGQTTAINDDPDSLGWLLDQPELLVTTIHDGYQQQTIAARVLFELACWQLLRPSSEALSQACDSLELQLSSADGRRLQADHILHDPRLARLRRDPQLRQALADRCLPYVSEASQQRFFAQDLTTGLNLQPTGVDTLDLQLGTIHPLRSELRDGEISFN